MHYYYLSLTVDCMEYSTSNTSSSSMAKWIGGGSIGDEQARCMNKRKEC